MPFQLMELEWAEILRLRRVTFYIKHYDACQCVRDKFSEARGSLALQFRIV